MGLTTWCAELPLAFVALDKQVTLGVYDMRCRPFVFNVEYNGTVGSFPRFQLLGS